MIWENEKLIREAVANSLSKKDAIEYMGMSALGATTRYKLNDAIERLAIDTSHFRKSVDWSDEENIANQVSKSRSITEALNNIGIKARSGNFSTLKKYIKKYKMDISHFDPIAAGMEKKKGTRFQPISLTEILNGNHPTYKTYSLKHRLIKEGILQNNCNSCKNEGHWRGRRLVLDLDHINGISDDHHLENLQLLCPNCHSQTPTFKTKKRD